MPAAMGLLSTTYWITGFINPGNHFLGDALLAGEEARAENRQTGNTAW